MFSQTRSRSRCQFGTFLYVILDVTCLPRLSFKLLAPSDAQNQTTHVEHDDAALSLFAAIWSACVRGRSQVGRAGRIARLQPSLARGWKHGTYLDVVPVAEATELLLPCRVPDVEADGAEVCVESEGVYLDSEGRCPSGHADVSSRDPSWPSRGRHDGSPMYFFSNSPC